ncbi:MAG: hypothetical protein ABSH48_08730 [Verrucomicrobiota bacterium]|jgi:hypothetical protein
MKFNQDLEASGCQGIHRHENSLFSDCSNKRLPDYSQSRGNSCGDESARQIEKRARIEAWGGMQAMFERNFQEAVGVHLGFRCGVPVPERAGLQSGTPNFIAHLALKKDPSPIQQIEQLKNHTFITSAGRSASHRHRPGKVG